MKLNETIRRLRRAKGLTQEQVAQALGVSGPAVNKWERGACCPDLALLAPLARLLDTDLNTLLSFREELTGAEIAAFTEELYTLAQSRGIDAAFLRAEELLHRWPGCDRLTISLAMTLNGLFFTLGVAEPEPYERRLEPLYRALADSEEPDIRDQALHLLIGRHMRREEYAAAEELLSDPEMRELAQEELTAAREEMERLRQELKLLLLPKDPNDRKNVILEIRAGTGGEEAALFAASLLRMYTMYAAARGWRTDTVELNETELGGVKECSVLIEGEGAWSRLKFESGVHRVQRVPVTESNGRIQTSAATVAVLPEAEGVDVKLDPADIEMQVYRASGAGGQHVNKTSSAVRLIHRPTGLVVECQQERSQFQNRDKAMRLLASRLYEIEREKQDADIARERKSQVGSGDRSEKIRTYNFPQGRVTDHRIGLTLYRIDAVLDGELDELIDALVTADQAEKLKNGGGEP